jgi:hypothetical protein
VAARSAGPGLRGEQPVAFRAARAELEVERVHSEAMPLSIKMDLLFTTSSACRATPPGLSARTP